MSNADIVLLVVAGYIAVVSLIRLMRHRRNQVYRKLEGEIQRQRERKHREARRDEAA